MSKEEARLAALKDYDILGTAPEAEYDRIARLAADLFDAPIALVSLVDRDRQWLKARIGLDVEATPRDVSFCAHAIQGDATLVVQDARVDARFADNPLVTGAPGIRFYAGAPLVAPSGHRLGALCLIDSKPRPPLTAQEDHLLRSLSALVVDHLELRRLRAQLAAWHSLAEAMSDALVVTDERLRVTVWNRAAAALFGFGPDEIAGKPLASIFVLGAQNDFEALLHPTGRRARRCARITGRRKDGSTFPAEVSLSALPDEGSVGCGAIVRDITQQHHHEMRLREMAYTDGLTGLANRASLRHHLEKILVDDGRATVLLVDVDGFKAVNDRLGHQAGDALLGAIAARLSWRQGRKTLVARLGGDEFAILVRGSADPLAAGALAEAVRADLQAPFDLLGDRAHVTASIGIALAPNHGGTCDVLLTSADLALYRVKEKGRNASLLYAPYLRSEAVARHQLGADLSLALDRDEFELHYQPQVRLDDGSIVGAEALLRWRHPAHGLLAPGRFLSVLEPHALAPRVGDWVLRTACAQAARWQGARPGLRIAVNLFAAQLRDPSLVERVEATLAATGLLAACLDIEVTETIALQDESYSIAGLRALHERGVQIALDDFGTGYASLSTLKLPLDRLKIDRGFVRDICTSPQDAAIVRAVIQLGRSFGLAVLAEGIETEEQRCRLLAKGCTEGQGYLFGKPMDAAAFTRQLIGKSEGAGVRDRDAGTSGAKHRRA